MPSDTLLEDSFMLQLVDRQRKGEAHFGDAGALVLWMEDVANELGESIAYVQMILELDPGTFERLDEIALIEKYGRKKTHA